MLFLSVLHTKCRDEEVNKQVAKALLKIAGYSSPEKHLKKALEKGGSVEAEIMAVLLGLSGGISAVLPRCLGNINKLIGDYKARGLDTDREEGIASCISKWASGDLLGAVSQAEIVLKHYPLDFLTLRLLCDARIILGQPEGYLSICQYVEPFWRKEKLKIEHCYVLGMLSFGLQECGYLKECRNAARKSLQGGAKDAWAVHAVVHSFTAEGKSVIGLQYLNATAKIWQDAELLAEHIWWHAGINHLDVGKPSRALSIYDKHLGGTNPDTPPTTAFALADSVGLLWRLYLMFPEVKPKLIERAKILCHGAELGGHTQAKVWAFTGCHVFAAAVLCEDARIQAEVLSSMEEAAKHPESDFGVICRDSAVLVCKGVRAHYDGRYHEAAAELRSAKLFKIGGSSAQRDTFIYTLLDSLVRSGSPEAPHLARTRSRENPSSPSTWLIRANSEAHNATQGAFGREILYPPLNKAAEMALQLEIEADRQILGGGMYQLVKNWKRTRKVPPGGAKL
eukprot:TRINITY_DN20677_c0_g1_i1.p1 TRINITY_DN20677_c0_g1~~TRINITY_DN20677_c0_g1_i1.p1  ORF type:complete len:509 (+),score=62.39 TRINITY_DN20677_c0_g1_i1:68-1594(+)